MSSGALELDVANRPPVARGPTRVRVDRCVAETVDLDVYDVAADVVEYDVGWDSPPFARLTGSGGVRIEADASVDNGSYDYVVILRDEDGGESRHLLQIDVGPAFSCGPDTCEEDAGGGGFLPDLGGGCCGGGGSVLLLPVLWSARRRRT